jgi:aspartyl-tRNA(Asn)/glutamyl-tRNA(Gln) amidotransferase subunit B
MSPPYDVIIGLEVHVQLSTVSKLFCGCSTRFGALPNTQTCPVCIGMPGVLPVMNRRALELAVKTAVALNCRIAPSTKWDRKNYYYPDLPKGYQISQYDLPLCTGGSLTVSDPKGRFLPKEVGIIRVHLEEDAGKSLHDEEAGVAESRIDLNRAGTPLVEIVTRPDMRSPQEAKAFLTELKLLLVWLGISDCNMQEGSLRVDANVNLSVLAPSGPVPTPIVEIKNMNSFRSVERAIEYEIGRQYEAWQATGQRLGDVPKQTRGWDDVANVTRGQRHKEESSDYRYFPEPDLVPVVISEQELARVRALLQELPAPLRTRLEAEFGVSPYDSDVIVNQGREFVEYFSAAARGCGDGKLASNWLQQDVLRTLNEKGGSIADYPVSAVVLAGLLRKVKAGEVNTSRGREVLARMVEAGRSVDEAMADLGIAQVDEAALVALCRELVAAHPKLVADIKGGKLQAAAAFIGHAKKKNPNVNPARVREICVELAREA